MREDIKKLAELIENSSNIVFFGGAGVSTESGVPDFRSQDGIYNQKYKYPPEMMISHSFFMRDTEEFYRFYKDRMVYPEARPNKAHLALYKLEQEGKLKAVITQNIDGLHQMAGSKEVLELHGSIFRNHCMNCGKSFSLSEVMEQEGVPRCDVCGGIIKPDVVLYEESLDMGIMRRAAEYISRADMLIVGGTSLVVYPAAGMIDYYNGDKLVLINRDATKRDGAADLIIRGNIGEVLGEAVGIV